MLHRTCTKCGIVKPETLEFFKANKECRAGLNTQCRSCANAYNRAYKRTHSDEFSLRRRQQYAAENGARHKAREWARAKRLPFKYSARNLMNGIWDRSRTYGYEVSPELRTSQFIEEWLRRQPNCECCNTKLDIGRKGVGCKNDASPSFDRFDLAKGYTLENTALVCWRCNNIKRNYSASDLRRVAAWIERRTHNQTDKFAEVVA